MGSVIVLCFILVHSSIVIVLVGKRELVALLNLSSWCLVMVELLFLAVLWGCLRFVIVVFPVHTHLLFLNKKTYFLVSVHHNNYNIGLNYQYKIYCPEKGCFSKCVNSLF